MNIYSYNTNTLERSSKAYRHRSKWYLLYAFLSWLFKFSRIRHLFKLELYIYQYTGSLWQLATHTLHLSFIHLYNQLADCASIDSIFACRWLNDRRLGLKRHFLRRLFATIHRQVERLTVFMKLRIWGPLVYITLKGTLKGH